jgi:TolB protein
VLLLILPLVAAGQSDPYRIEIQRDGYRRITLKILEPEIDGSNAALRQAANEARETLARDLIYSGLFYVTDQWASPYLPRGVSRAWNVANEQPERRPHEIAALWRIEEGEFRSEMRLLDALGTQIAGKRYKVDANDARDAMHHFADEVVKRLTGVDGTAQTKIAFARVRGGGGEIYTVDYDGFGERQVTNRSTLTHSPVWGLGRSWIAFTSYVDENPNLYRVDQGSSRLRVVSRRPGLNTAPDWCQERSLFALTLSHEGNAEIYTIREDGGRLKRLTHHPAIDTAPTWSPRGDQIAFTSDRSGVPQIYAMDGDGGHVRRLTYHNRYSDSPAWSPDGRWIAYVARWEGNIELRLMKPDGTNQRVVVSAGLNDGPTWAKDSRHIAFSSLRGGSRAIYVVDIYTGLERRLTSGTGDAITPAWSRD